MCSWFSDFPLVVMVLLFVYLSWQFHQLLQFHLGMTNIAVDHSVLLFSVMAIHAIHILIACLIQGHL